MRFATLALCFLAAFAFLTSSLAAQVAQQVIDIDPRLLEEQSGNPNEITPAGDLTYFTARGSIRQGVWATDGSPGDARLLTDSTGVAFHGLIGDRMLFSGTTDERLIRLWSSDGTRAGTVLLATYEAPGNAFVEQPDPLISQGLLFLARQEASETVIWVSDGTPQGSRDVLTLETTSLEWVQFNNRVAILSRSFGLWMSDGTPEGTEQVYEGFSLRDLTAAAGRLYFLSDRSGPQLWTSDGTEAGTSLLGAFDSNARMAPLATGEQGLYLAVSLESTGEEIWLSDGTQAGTRQITELEEPFALGFNDQDSQAVEIGGRLVFQAFTTNRDTGQLFVTDGQPSTTRALTDLDPGVIPDRGLPTMVRAGDRVLFMAQVGGFPESYQVWVSDGTEEGTLAVTDPCPAFGCNVSQYGILPGLDGWIFGQNPGGQDSGIWTTDGTSAGTRQVAQLGIPQLRGAGLAMNGETLYFNASGLGLGFELWRTEGTEESTRLVANLTGQEPASSFPSLSPFGDRMIFTACNDDEKGLYNTGGTEDTTHLVTILDRFGCSSSPDQPIEVNGHLVLSPDRFESDQLRATNGEPGDLRELTAFTNPGQEAGFLLDRVGNRVLFTVRPNFSAPTQIWETDGTAAGTRLSGLTSELGLTGFESSKPVGDRLLLVRDDFFTRQTWLTDGTVAGTQQLLLQDGGFGQGPLEAEKLGGDYFFTTQSTDVFLWRSGGTEDTTQPVLVADGDGPITSEIIRLRRLGDRLLFFAQAPDFEWGLWSTDGSEAGTELLASFPRENGFGFDNQPEAVILGNRMLFSIIDDASGREPWITDGTAAGTELLLDIEPGAVSSDIRELVVLGDRAYFSAEDSIAGQELWTTDGTPAGTRRLADVSAGPRGSFPFDLQAAGSDLYFSADDGVTGRELWTVPSADESGCTDGPTQLCLGEGRFQVTIDWEDFDGNTGRGQAVPLSDDTGAFWFFGPQNLEAMVKIIDGRQNNGHFWVFYGSLTNVAFELTVVDAVTGRSAIYINPAGEFASAGDIQALPAGGSQAVFSAIPVSGQSQSASGWPTQPNGDKVGGCVADAQTLCLAEGRFRARVQWTDFVGSTGSGQSVPLTEDTGTFWFFGPQNLELMVKIIDGRDFNDKFWVFYGALTNVAFQLTVEDTVTGASVFYDNASGTFASRGDIEALPGR